MTQQNRGRQDEKESKEKQKGRGGGGVCDCVEGRIQKGEKFSAESHF